jgi:hypothetical protein
VAFRRVAHRHILRILWRTYGHFVIACAINSLRSMCLSSCCPRARPLPCRCHPKVTSPLPPAACFSSLHRPGGSRRTPSRFWPRSGRHHGPLWWSWRMGRRCRAGWGQRHRGYLRRQRISCGCLPPPPPRQEIISHLNTVASGVPTRRIVQGSTQPQLPSNDDASSVSVDRSMVAAWAEVRSRPAPTAAVIGRLVALRFGTELGEALAGALSAQSGWPPVTKRLVQAGLPSLRTWQAAVKVIQASCHASRNGWSQAGAAQNVGRTAKSLSRCVSDLFSVRWSELVALPTWEGRLELFLRANGNGRGLEATRF